MFVILLTYVKPLADVDALLHAHNEFLDRHFAAGTFLLSGRKEPRSGGVIMALARSREEVADMLEEDPFKVHGVATYAIVEFTPTRARDDMKQLLSPTAVAHRSPRGGSAQGR